MSLKSSSKRNTAPRTTTEEAKSARGRRREKTLANTPNTMPAARDPKTLRSSKRVNSTRGRSNLRKESHRSARAGATPRRRETRKSCCVGMNADRRRGPLLKSRAGPLSTLTTGWVGLWALPSDGTPPMPGKQARALCPVCQEPMPPDETACENCGAFVIDEAVVRLSRAFGIDREKALQLFEAGFRHPTQLRDRDLDGVLERRESGLLFICTNCGSFVAGKDNRRSEEHTSELQSQSNLVCRLLLG